MMSESEICDSYTYMNRFFFNNILYVIVITIILIHYNILYRWLIDLKYIYFKVMIYCYIK